MEGLMVLAFPLLAFLVTGLLGRQLGDRASGVITVLGGAFSFVFSLYMVYRALHSPVQIKLYEFLPLEGYTLSVGFYFDALSSITAAVVTLVATLIFVYSIGYMEDEFGKWVYKFYAYLSLFLFAMLLIVLSDNLLGIFFGWEGVGLASYLLIGYYHQQRKATNAALEAFVMNRIGDWLFIFGIIATFLVFKSLDIVEIFGKVDTADKALIGIATLLLFGGAVGKSGQLPLHTWLPNAMAGPTPVSALLHAATMVAAGVYMVARLYPVFEAAPQTLKVVAVIGGLTALFAALAATSHTDMKKIIAFSTMSQLGYMFLALGVGDRGGAMFHLTTHAFFKALLFLAAGSVITAFHHKLYDIYNFGGLKKYMPVTYASFVIGAMALAGIFPLSGFWSKDRLIGSYYEASFVWGLVGTVVAFLTAYYIFREGFVVFHGEERFRGIDPHEPREVGAVMTVPMVVLGVMAVVAGFFEGWYMHAVGDEHKDIHLNVALVSLGVAILGIVLAYGVFVKRFLDPEKTYESLKALHTTFREQFFTEKLYHGIFALGYLSYSKVLYAVGERQLIDGLVNGTAAIVQSVGHGLKVLQNGKLNWYALGLGAGFAILVLLFVALIYGGGY
ncbi:NADH-quinone oxidoreductase subunit L [Hydrogenivirga caldilitoris]|uniref:NADH-quinone oxidoreductase subunit L n=1 Tax=Hydrogenivirga caldilitoris TaxID=246264 RepID=A0A497XT51_9AQUI|nr:NADH-quinone oxidoreductase subunit L [Hydrogenivirga caldilitoris]RLJ71484.1 NADH-quinone oxidoreductase subunit L [Hydrogenivirga caldilitoris]